MFFRIQHLTEDIYSLEFIDSSVSTQILLSVGEIGALEQMLQKIPELPVGTSVDGVV